MKRVEMVGKTFGRLTVVSEASKSANNGLRWHCSCECGATSVVAGTNLRNGNSTSCGCRSREVVRLRRTTHGQSKVGNVTPEYRTWTNVKSRCTNTNFIQFKDYGGRGITMHPAWAAEFSVFLADMGPRPSKYHSIERIDNSRGYEPNNCRWANRREQANNRRSNLCLAYGGQVDTLANWARIVGVPLATLWARTQVYGWDSERAITTPVRPRKGDNCEF